MSKAIETLMNEHRLIEQVLGSLATFAGGLEDGDPDARPTLAGFARFFSELADRCHHGKEEDGLFAALADAGFPREVGPVRVMLEEHVLGRAHVAALAAAGARGGPLAGDELEDVRRHAREYVALLSAHIQKEDQILFPAAERALQSEVLEDLARQFEAHERDEMGDGTHEQLHELAEELISRWPPSASVARTSWGQPFCHHAAAGR